MDLKESRTYDHEHVMTITNEEKYNVDCAKCQQRCSGFTFNCIFCQLHAHKQCISKPNSFKSPYHLHVLALRNFITTFECDACYAKIEDFYYSCGKCDVAFHIECAFLIKADNEDQILHATHLHPLSRGSEGEDDIEVLNCKACDKSCSGKAYYGCNACKFFLHKSCAVLPEEIAIFFERNATILHLVTLLGRFTCYVCGDERHGFYYRRGTGSLQLMMDVECALTIHKSQAQSSNLDDVYFTCHRHPLTFQDKREDGTKLICRTCEEEICSGATYGCSSCNYFLHTSCTELKHITRPYHPHPLKLVYHWPNEVWCRLCSQNCNGAFYACANDCNFSLHVECSSIKSVIEFQGHPHPLVFVEKVSRKVKCSLCKTSTNLLVFQCLEHEDDYEYDGYKLDLLCGPIPRRIKSRHMHALDLHDSYVEDDTGEDSCDICEQRRDPRQPVYFCHLCENRGYAYVAEIKCVMPEVLRALRGDLGVVELRTVGTRVPGKVITELGKHQEADHEEVKTNASAPAEAANDAEDEGYSLLRLWMSSTEDDRNKIYALEEDKSLRGKKYEKLSDVIQFSDEAFKLLMESLDYGSRSEITFHQQLEKLVKVAGDYMIPRTFETIYADLTDKYGDVSKDCDLSSQGKSMLLAELLSVIFTMRRKQVSRVTEDDLRDCHLHLKYLRRAGFRIQFAIKNLSKLARAYFGLQLDRFARDMLQDLDQRFARHSKAIEEQEAKLQVVWTRQEEHMRRIRAKKSSLMDKCLSEARALRYKVGWELLLYDDVSEGKVMSSGSI